MGRDPGDPIEFTEFIDIDIDPEVDRGELRWSAEADTPESARAGGGGGRGANDGWVKSVALLEPRPPTLDAEDSGFRMTRELEESRAPLRAGKGPRGDATEESRFESVRCRASKGGSGDEREVGGIGPGAGAEAGAEVGYGSLVGEVGCGLWGSGVGAAGWGEGPVRAGGGVSGMGGIASTIPWKGES